METLKLDQINPSSALFIKLGQNTDNWEYDCIEKVGTLRLGFKEFTHDDLLSGNLQIVRDYFTNEKKSAQWITKYENQIRNFYHADENVLWITFYNQKLWWCFAEKRFEGEANELKLRFVKDKWRSTDIYGKELFVDNLSGQLLKTQNYRSTICNVKAFDYLVKKINGIVIQEIFDVKNDIMKLQTSIGKLIRMLNSKDFEIFVDLIFRQIGFLRTNVIGGVQKMKDIELLSSVKGERILVQVKCESTFEQYDDYKKYFLSLKGYSNFYYVVHSPDSCLNSFIEDDKKIIVWTLEKLSELTITTGLTSWLIHKIA